MKKTFISLTTLLHLTTFLYAGEREQASQVHRLIDRSEVQDFIKRIQALDPKAVTQNSLPLYFTTGSIDQKDYIRLVNIKRLLDERRMEVEQAHADPEGKLIPFERRLAFLTDLSLQVDGLSTQESYIRYLTTPKGISQAFWRRLAYMHHGLNLAELSDSLRRHMVNTIWEGKWEGDEIGSWAELSLMARGYNKNRLLMISPQSQDICNLLVQINLSWELNAFQELEKFITTLLEIEIERHYYEQMCREWPWRLEELASEFWFSPRPLHMTIALNQPDASSLGSPKMKINEIDKNPALTGYQKFERSMKIVQAKAKGVKSNRIESLNKKVEELIDKKEKAIKAYINKASADINLPNVRFYMGIINEYENLHIALNSLLRTTQQIKSGKGTLDLVLQTISIISEAFNNVILPNGCLPIEIEADILAFRETLRYIRNKVNEHPDLLQSIQYKNFMKEQILQRDIVDNNIINNIVNKDFKIIETNILNRLKVLKKIISAEEGWENLLDIIRSKFYGLNEKLEGGKGKRVTEPEKERAKWKSSQQLLETDLWQDNGLPTLEGLRRYFFHPTYSLESILIDRTQLELAATLVYGAELGWAIDHLLPVNIQTLKSKIQELIYFFPILLDNTKYLDEFREKQLLEYKELYGDTDSSVLREIDQNLYGFDYPDLGYPRWAVAAFPKNITDINLKYQILYRLINAVYEQLDLLISKEETSFFEELKPRFRNLIRYLYQNLREKRNYFAHDLWRVNDERFSKISQECAKNIAMQLVSILWQALDKPERVSRQWQAPDHEGDFLFELNFIKAVKENNLKIIKQEITELLNLKTSIGYLLQFGPKEGRKWLEFLNGNLPNRNKKTKRTQCAEILNHVLWYGTLYDPTLGVNFIDKEGRTAFHYAAEIGKLELIDYLFEKGGFPDLKDDKGHDALQILEDYLNKTADDTAKTALQSILKKLKERTRLQDSTKIDEIYSAVKRMDFTALEQSATHCFSLNMYDTIGNTLFTLLGGREQHSIYKWLIDHGADSTLKPLKEMDYPTYVHFKEEEGYLLFSDEREENPSTFATFHERPALLYEDINYKLALKGAKLITSPQKPEKDIEFIPIRPGYSQKGGGFGAATSPYAGTEQGMINYLTNFITTQIQKNIGTIITRATGKCLEMFQISSTFEAFLQAYEIYKNLPWSPRWITHFLSESHPLNNKILPYLAEHTGNKYIFNGELSNQELGVNILPIALPRDEAAKYLKTTKEAREMVVKDIIDIFHHTELPRGLLYPREKERFILPNSIELDLPDSFIKNREMLALRSRISYLSFAINMLKKYLYLDIPNLRISSADDFVQTIRGQAPEWQPVLNVLQEYINDIGKIEETLKNYLMHSSSLYNDFVDYFLQDNRWLKYYNNNISQTLQALAQFKKSTIYIWKQTNEVGPKDLMLHKEINCINSSDTLHFLYFDKLSPLIPLTLFGEKEGKSFQDIVEEMFRTSVCLGNSDLLDEKTFKMQKNNLGSKEGAIPPEKATAQASSKCKKNKRKKIKKAKEEAIKKAKEEAIKKAKEEAAELYGEDLGYVGVSDDIYYDENGQKYVCIKLDGSNGDCCFHALGIKREDMIEKMKEYVDECEKELSNPEISTKINNNIYSRNLCDQIFTTAEDRDIKALRGHSLSDWKTKIIEATDNEDEKEQLNATFKVMIEQQGADPVDWDKVLTSAQLVKELIYRNTSEDNKLILYKEFVGKFIADLWKRVGDDKVLSEIESHLRNDRVRVLDEEGEPLRGITDDDLNFSALPVEKEQDDINHTNKISRLASLEKNPKLKNYVKYKVEFLSATAERKKEILEQFYLFNREWLDPSAIIYLGPHFGFKAKLFRRNGHFSPLHLDAQTPNANNGDEMQCRLIVYVNDNHYDLLFPIGSFVRQSTSCHEF